MSKTKLLLDVVDDIRRLADSLQAVADAMDGNTTNEDRAHESIPGSPPDSVSQEHTPAQVTIEQVRAVLAEKSSDGKTEAVKALLSKYDADKLSGVKQEDYEALLEEAMNL